MPIAPPVPLSALEALRINVIVGRASARISQDELAKRANVARPTISRIERGIGNVKLDVVQRLADSLGVAVSDLFVPAETKMPDDAELLRRSEAPDTEYVDADALFAALDEANGRRKLPPGTERYSRAGHPHVNV